MSDVTMSMDVEGRWMLTLPLTDEELTLRLTVETPGTPYDWHSFAAWVAGSDGDQLLGTFEIAPSELYSDNSPRACPEVEKWDPHDEDDFQRILKFQREFAVLVNVWAQVISAVVPAMTPNTTLDQT